MSISQNESSQQSFDTLYSHWSATTDYSEAQLKLLSQLTVTLGGAWLEIYNQAIEIHPNRPQAAHYIAMNLVCCGAQGYLGAPSVNYNIGAGTSGDGKSWPNKTIEQTIPFLKSKIYQIPKPKSGDAFNKAFLAFDRPNCLFYMDEGLGNLLANFSKNTKNNSFYEAYKVILSCHEGPTRLLGSKNKHEGDDTPSVEFPRLTFNVDGQYSVFAECLTDPDFMPVGFFQRALFWQFKSPKGQEIDIKKEAEQPQRLSTELAIKDVTYINDLIKLDIKTTRIADLQPSASYGLCLPPCLYDWTKHYYAFCEEIKKSPNLYSNLTSRGRTNARLRYLADVHCWGRGKTQIEQIDVEVASLIISLSYENFKDIIKNCQQVPDEELLLYQLLKVLSNADQKGYSHSCLYNVGMRFAQSQNNQSLKSRYAAVVKNLIEDQLIVKSQNKQVSMGKTKYVYTFFITPMGKEYLTKKPDWIIL